MEETASTPKVLTSGRRCLNCRDLTKVAASDFNQPSFTGT
jgi:hypothetical protein